ncbi:hypothetical protein QWY31_12270 [Cytophagales bacterium LB-30]|uniref:Uncharacterized protein n=1 Tax=Shiella aurantiaca TaxID=3058365 RepID=A0ABT8F8K8_9BACT|nr:hypothetical protein [Shiella aurantiaca]MDN4166281.1 hypothetical protein [Shiella aurantiaca]
MTRKQINILAWALLIGSLLGIALDNRPLIWAFMASYLVVFLIRLFGWYKKED